MSPEVLKPFVITHTRRPRKVGRERYLRIVVAVLELLEAQRF